ncbi:right-handed parallel beta-helix repeat-containing protein [Hymenobacter psychrophilus]|uniref:Right handed beta helix region n=1 Tax=Hymenobacter psychrophilus TaxID=651662 RepID=A0A1H3L9G3_9BACT|nr:coagulation factor 5/8 type domain-containing protein [Hymenobacter psychrophilus]SDY61031.1 Right handed beta helix region [Hymenobacter psychrophilus]
MRTSLLLGSATAALLTFPLACAKTSPSPGPAVGAGGAVVPPAGRQVAVATAAQLQAALGAARPGDVITLADGTYTGQFSIARGLSGTAGNSIVLQGSRQALLQTGNRKSGNAALFLLGNEHWEFRGFTVANSKKGVMVDFSSHNVFAELSILDIGEEGIHFRRFSSYNVLRNSTIQGTGLEQPGYGEGCYIGSAKSNWATYTEGEPDKCDFNQVLDNVFGNNVKAENIDIKEGTTGGIIRGNAFNGQGLDGANYADSWLDVKGNNNLISANTGTNGGPVLLDGYQTHVAVAGWGEGNVFRDNQCAVQAAGYGFNIQTKNGSALGNQVHASNRVTGAAAGVANVPVTP